MALENCNCFEKVETFFRVSPCPCPPSETKPWEKYTSLCTANFDFSENRDEVESNQNRGTRNCTKSISNGADYSPEFDMDFAAHANLVRGVMGARQLPKPDTNTVAAATIDITAENMICSDDVDFAQMGFECGMLVALSDFGTAANNSDPVDHGGEYFQFYLIKDITKTGDTSCLTLCTEANSVWTPPLLFPDTGGQIVAINNPWVASNDNVFADFQRVISSKSEEIYQKITQALLSNLELTFTPNGFVEASITGTGQKYENNIPAFAGLKKSDEECDSCCDTAFWKIEKENVQLYVGCSNLCVSELSISINRNPNNQLTSCGNKVSSGRFEAEISATVLLGEGEYTAKFFDDLAQGNKDCISIRWYDENLGRMEYLTFPTAQLLETPLNTDEGECVTMALRWKAVEECNKPIAIGGHTYDSAVCVENAFCFKTNAEDVDFTVTGAAGDVFIDENGNNLSDQTGADGANSIAYTDGITNHDVQVWDLEDTPWTEIEAPDAGILEFSICHLKALETVDLSGNPELEFGNFGNLPNLTTIDVSGNTGMTGLSIEGSFLVTTIDASGTNLTSGSVDKLLCDLVDYGQSGGTLTLNAATQYSSLASTKVAELIAIGWTVTP